MKTLIPLSMLFAAVTATGCTSDSTSDDGGGTGGDGTGSETEQPVPTTAEGTYQMQSEFDLATNLPGTAGTVASYFIQMTDDPEDPTLFIVQKVIDALPDGSIKNALRNATPFVAGYLNDRLLEVAPSFVGKIVDIGDAFGQIAKGFGTTEILEIDAAGNATKTVTGLHFEIDNVDTELAFRDYALSESRIEGLTVSLASNGQLTVSEHRVAMKYGQVLKLALDQAIIPLIDPAAANLSDLMHEAVDCEAVGAYIYDAIGFGSASTFESACNAGLTAAANLAYTKMAEIDASALEFGLAGTARGVDRNRDGKMDEILTGSWTGDLTYAGTPAPLSTAKFHGARQ